MKILNALQTKELDVFTQQEQKITSLDLMERAANECAKWIVHHYRHSTHFTVFCGLGNNGGDGLAIARILLAKSYKVTIYVVKYRTKTSSDFNKNLDLLKGVVTLRTIVSEKHIPKVPKNSIVIDAIMGAGINRPLEGLCKILIEKLNNYKNTKISIDIPTGLGYENHQFSKENTIFTADYTLTFEVPKLCFLLPETASYIGEFTTLPIGSSKKHQKDIVTDYEYLQLDDVQKNLLKRDKFSHKGNFGHVEIIGGSLGKTGAIVLATKASLKSGAGLATAYTPNSGMQILQTTIPEAMWAGNNSTEDFLEGNYINTHKTVGIGPGLGIHPNTQTFFHLVLKATNTPMVIDADAINILAKNKEWLTLIPKNSILTPHPKEFERLVGIFKNDTEKLEKLKYFAVTFNCIVILKGAHTAICNSNGKIYFNSNGNPGMATGGSGDVLMGIITGLLAQSYTPIQSAILGVYLHGFAGDLAIKQTSELSLIASDIVDHIGNAYLHINFK